MCSDFEETEHGSELPIQAEGDLDDKSPSDYGTSDALCIEAWQQWSRQITACGSNADLDMVPSQTVGIPNSRTAGSVNGGNALSLEHLNQWGRWIKSIKPSAEVPTITEASLQPNQFTPHDHPERLKTLAVIPDNIPAMVQKVWENLLTHNRTTNAKLAKLYQNTQNS
ncbi:uncharacterized protein LOC122563822 isoform X1 [Chiloscyllium plagiosum]|uniref:uncharacterized protein LOC122563822 isoform X1 n=1 Tax=Chiloscyllium plagiosum TaxID=36176 RepID=UPI001CB7B71F|nr:uncharacterized protein LOC122563822 isoform X1 [Chiloscyllium plagiosum]